jgi:hypothetical protein
MVKHSTNINKTNNHLSPQLIEHTAEESVEFLEAEFDKKNSHLKTQTSKGNILETIAFRSEESENRIVSMSCDL